MAHRAAVATGKARLQEPQLRVKVLRELWEPRRCAAVHPLDGVAVAVAVLAQSVPLEMRATTTVQAMAVSVSRRHCSLWPRLNCLASAMSRAARCTSLVAVAVAPISVARQEQVDSVAVQLVSQVELRRLPQHLPTRAVAVAVAVMTPSGALAVVQVDQALSLFVICLVHRTVLLTRLRG